MIAAARKAHPNLRSLCNDFDALRRAVLRRMEKTCRIGWIDHSPLSYDWLRAGVRAHRIQQRIVFNRRLSPHQLRRECPI